MDSSQVPIHLYPCLSIVPLKDKARAIRDMVHGQLLDGHFVPTTDSAVICVAIPLITQWYPHYQSDLGAELAAMKDGYDHGKMRRAGLLTNTPTTIIESMK